MYIWHAKIEYNPAKCHRVAQDEAAIEKLGLFLRDCLSRQRWPLDVGWLLSSKSESVENCPFGGFIILTLAI